MQRIIQVKPEDVVDVFVDVFVYVAVLNLAIEYLPAVISLGGSVSVTLLVVTLLLARAAVRRFLFSGDDETSNSAETDPTPSP